MEGIAIQKYVHMSPRKVRIVADLVRKIKPQEAVTYLPLVNKRAAHPVQKTIRAAIANAVQQGANPDELVFKEIQVNQGPKLKRFRAASRGRALPYARKMSHIKVIVITKSQNTNSKDQTIEENTKVKKGRASKSK